MSPIPEDVHLPCGWVCKRVSEDALVLGHEEGLEVEAARTDESHLLPFGLSSGWELIYRIRSGDSVSERVIGRVTTRTAALDALRSCAERVSTLVRTTGSTGSLSPSEIVRDIELRDEIPSGSDSPRGTTN